MNLKKTLINLAACAVLIRSLNSGRVYADAGYTQPERSSSQFPIDAETGLAGFALSILFEKYLKRT